MKVLSARKNVASRSDAINFNVMFTFLLKMSTIALTSHLSLYPPPQKSDESKQPKGNFGQKVQNFAIKQAARR
ncbi:hypothetical protein BMS83_09995, partial [Leuconostoc pseudomesenteroides]